MSRPILLAALALALAGCGSVFGPDTETWDVAEVRIPCYGVGPMECVLVRTTSGGDLGLFYGSIRGFEWQPGYRYRVVVETRPIRNAPADGSSIEYTLKRILSREASPHAALLATIDEAEARWNAARPVDYTIVLQRNCFCGMEAVGPVRVEVTRREGNWTSPFERTTDQFYVDSGQRVPGQFTHLFPNVQWLFGHIRWAIASDAHNVAVEFADSGYPLRAWIDRSAAIADDEVEYVTLSLTPRD